MKYKTIVIDPPWKYGKWAAPKNRKGQEYDLPYNCLLYTSPSPRDQA